MPWNSLPPRPSARNEASAIGWAQAFSDTGSDRTASAATTARRRTLKLRFDAMEFIASKTQRAKRSVRHRLGTSLLRYRFRSDSQRGHNGPTTYIETAI